MILVNLNYLVCVCVLASTTAITWSTMTCCLLLHFIVDCIIGSSNGCLELTRPLNERRQFEPLH